MTHLKCSQIGRNKTRTSDLLNNNFDVYRTRNFIFTSFFLPKVHKTLYKKFKVFSSIIKGKMVILEHRQMLNLLSINYS